MPKSAALAWAGMPRPSATMEGNRSGYDVSNSYNPLLELFHLGLLYPALCCFDEVPEGFLRCSLLFAVNRRFCYHGLTALANWLVLRNR